MIRQLFKIIITQWRANRWLFGELLIATGVLWIMLDGMLVKARIYYSPLGYDISNTYLLSLSNLNPGSPGFVPKEQYTSTETEDLLQLMNRIRLQPEVEEVCASYYSCPYSWGNSWSSILPVDGDTSLVITRSFQVRRVTPEFFTVFRVKDKYGHPIDPREIAGSGGQIVISEDMKQLFFGNQQGRNRKIRYEGTETEINVAYVCQPIREMDYSVSQPCFLR